MILQETSSLPSIGCKPMGKHKAKRNDPCPCGSGKKYKHCCYHSKTDEWRTARPHESPAFAVKPKNTVVPITQHAVSFDGGKTFEMRPGTGPEIAIRMHFIDSKDRDASIEDVRKSVANQIEMLNLHSGAKQNLIECISEVDHKLHAVKYHLNNYIQAESNRIDEYIRNHKASGGVMQTVVEDPRLIYEIEAFLLQTKSCLDALSWILKPTFGMTYCKFGDKGDDIIKYMKKSCPSKLGIPAEKVIKLVEGAQDDWVVEMIEMRDEVAHYSRLKGFDCFIEDPYTGGVTVDIHYPTMPNKQRALDYCQFVWAKLLDFCRDFLTIALETAKEHE